MRSWQLYENIAIRPYSASQIHALLFIEELAHVRLEVHDDKTKIITSDLHNSIDYVNISDKMIEVLDCDKSHKYLGKFINATSTRSTFELQHRIKVA